MRAARIHAWGAAPVVEEVPEPVREEGRVLVEVQAGAVAHLDASVAGGDFRLKPQLPYIGGVEGAGVVLEADPDSGLTPGTQVVLRGGGLGLQRDGTWTERTSVSPKACMPLETALPPETAASFFVPATTAYVVLHDVARLREGERVVVVGASGAVGSMVAQQARAAGADVLGVVGRKDQLGDVPDGIQALVLDEAEHLGEQRSADLLVDTLGGAGLIGRSRWVRQGGRAAVIGYVTGTAVELDLPSWLLDDVALLPVNMIRQEKRAREVCGELVRRLADGTLGVAVETFPLEDTVKALDALRNGRVRGRAVVLPR
ncbi:zinc-binding dehydrogenase [Streptomyces sp. NRRL S-1868]|uniref:zinc-binding dehydrogenase n=1 Tax=Streptomyces sp. NRRL S-1868 TaxID=1463892 RepID=UPI0004C4B9CC|nr:zinc-binding dehydrogenase [Streptomyces sp. NRRL S-1868]